MVYSSFTGTLEEAAHSLGLASPVGGCFGLDCVMARRRNIQDGIIILKNAASVRLKINPAKKYASMRLLAGRFCRNARMTLRYPQRSTTAKHPTPTHPRFA
jgi:hypothetical protein